MPFVEASSRSNGGFYRAGKLWPPGGAIHELTAEQVLAVQAESSLVVSGIANSFEELEARRATSAKAEADMRRQVEEARQKQAAQAANQAAQAAEKHENDQQRSKK